MDSLANITTPPTENVTLPMNSTLTSTLGDTSSLWITGDAMTTESYISTAMNAKLPTWNSTMDLNVTTARPTPDPSTCLIFVPDKVLNSINDKVVDEILMPSLVFTIMMFVIGVPGNLVVFYVYWRRWRKTTSRLFIMALAAFDLCNCVSMAFEIEIILNAVQFNHPSRCKFARMFTFLMNNSSSFTLLVIAIDRYMRICRPLKPAMTNIHAKIAVAVAVVMAIVAAFPAAVLYGTQTRIMKTSFPNICIKMHLCLIEDGYTTSNLPLIFTSFLLAGNILIDFILIFCYICIAVQVIRRGQFNDGCLSKGRENSISSTATDHDVLESTDSPYKATPIVLARQASLASSEVNGDINKAEGKTHTRNVNGSTSRSTGGSSINSKPSASFKRSQFKKQRSMSTQSIESRRAQMYKTTLMLFLVTLLFMVSFIPYCVIVIIRYIQPNYYETLTKGGKACFQIFLRTYLLSSALNPVIYSFLSEQFRNETIKIFKSTFCKKKYAFTR
ncbi:uncharacterized protein LOC110465762 [Mizuhopecten yessoensis]|uniref:Orexin receptor type 2 n=1 Tax=Mizuhopecten yessoensis TaxID=6573 RepID=A0A210PQQ1_MIZYE|nr:uncharacterized protein LOC110465762 [Mizuhopecten yessoensis]OWF38830.1 Orexin receptor type 2 [Mizuhopecten yessoensis]